MFHASNLTRYSAFGIHLVASLAIFLSLSAVIVFMWYPGPLFQIDGGWEGLRIVAFVDVVLGPLLTLIVYRAGKPGLKIDMGIIIALQVAALGYGIITLHDNRPVLLVFADDRINAIPLSVAKEMDPSGKVLQRFSERPARVVVVMPSDPIESADYILERMRARKPLHLEYQDYAPMADHWPAVIDDSLDIEHYVRSNDQWQAELHAEISKLGKTPQELVFLPVEGRYKSGILMADPETGAFIGYLDIRFDAALARKKRLVRDRL